MWRFHSPMRRRSSISALRCLRWLWPRSPMAAFPTATAGGLCSCPGLGCSSSAAQFAPSRRPRRRLRSAESCRQLGRAAARRWCARSRATEHLVRAIAYLTMFYTLGPMIAPLFGGVLIDTMGWRSVFGFALVAGALIAVAAYAWIFETRPQLSGAADETAITRGYFELFRNPSFVGYVLQSGFNTAAFMTTASAAATLMKELLARSATEFGFYFVVFPLGFFFGNWLSSRIGNRRSNDSMVLAGSVLLITTILVQAAPLHSGMVAPWSLFVPGFFLTFSQGIALPYAQVGAMATIPRL